MRSRYTAYATSSTAHLMATTHPMSPHFESDRSAWQRSLLEFCTRTDFLGLTVHSARQDAARGWVHFTAHLRQAGQEIPMTEYSEFWRVGDRWMYVRGISPP